MEADNLPRSALTRTHWLELQRSGNETTELVLEEVVVAEVDVEQTVGELLQTLAELILALSLVP
jgi:hypothetical protein